MNFDGFPYGRRRVAELIQSYTVWTGNPDDHAYRDNVRAIAYDLERLKKVNEGINFLLSYAELRKGAPDVDPQRFEQLVEFLGLLKRLATHDPEEKNPDGSLAIEPGGTFQDAEIPFPPLPKEGP